MVYLLFLTQGFNIKLLFFSFDFICFLLTFEHSNQYRKVMKKLFLLLLVFIFTSSFTPLYGVILLGQSKVKREVPVKGTTGVPIFRSPNYSPVYICIYGNVLSIDWKKSIGTVFVQILNLDTNEFVLSDDYDAVTGETVEVFIKNAGRYQIMITSELYSGYGDFFVNE